MYLCLSREREEADIQLKDNVGNSISLEISHFKRGEPS
jgi:hypothetical protein